MLKRRVTESTLDTYAARMRPSDLVASAFGRPTGRPADPKPSGRRPNRPEGPQRHLPSR